MFVCLFVFNVPSTARSFRDGTPIYCPLAISMTCSVLCITGLTMSQVSFALVIL